MATVGRNRPALVILSIVAVLSVRSTAAQPSLDTVLARAGQYVTTLHQTLSGIVAEETYVQAITFGGDALPRKTLKSDLLLVRPEGSDRYVEFRDVFEVNGRPVRDRNDRLTQLFLSPTKANVEQVWRIVEESARHNLGAIPRNINTPMLTLYFLQPEMQRRFRFRRERSGWPQLGAGTRVAPEGHAVFRTSTEMWVITFEERHRPTIIRTSDNHDFPATGRFWINPDTGAVLMSELAMRTGSMAATINVSYQSEPLLGLLVPAEMRELYRSNSERVEGVATYGKFRQFRVSVSETIGRPPGH